MSSETEAYFKKLTDDHIRRISLEANKDMYSINGKEYRRRKITVREFDKLEELRAQFNSEKDMHKARVLLTALYLEAAKYYLSMTEAEFYDSGWEELKLALDACSFRTTYGAPFSSSSSTGYSG